MTAIRWKSEFTGDFDAASNYAAGDSTGDSRPSIDSAGIQFNAGRSFVDFASAVSVSINKGPKLTTLVSFTGPDGSSPGGSLIADAAGDLLGTTGVGGANGDGTVFEVTKNGAGYADTPTVLVSFTGADGQAPLGSLITDAAGDLFGTTAGGGTGDDGTVFEIARIDGGYASLPTTLVSFTGVDGALPRGDLIADAAGDLFGTTSEGGANGYGTVFEIAKTGNGYAGTPATLVSFTSAEGDFPSGSLIADAAGDLFGTTTFGGAKDAGTVFEIAKTDGGYASAPKILVSFDDHDGKYPQGSLIVDAAGDLFGTTGDGGADNDGVVFEITKTKHGYASTPTILVSFTGADGKRPYGSLIADAAGDLFGTTYQGGIDDNVGTVFEIAKTRHGYSSTPITLVSFAGHHGENPIGSLTADAAGDIFGTTLNGGADDHGTVFEITHSGFKPPNVTAVQLASAATDAAHSPPYEAAFVQAMAAITGHGVSAGLIDARTINEGRQMMLAAPRLAIA